MARQRGPVPHVYGDRRRCELVVLAPVCAASAKDDGIDRLIRRPGYRGTPHTREQVRRDPELASSLSAAAHSIYGSSEGRFRVRWAAGGLSAEEVQSVGYEWADVGQLLQRYAKRRPQSPAGWRRNLLRVQPRARSVGSSRKIRRLKAEQTWSCRAHLER